MRGKKVVNPRKRKISNEESGDKKKKAKSVNNYVNKSEKHKSYVKKDKEKPKSDVKKEKGQKERHVEEEKDESFEYFEQVVRRLELGFDDEEEKDLFLKNVLEETKNKEIHLSCSRFTSHSLEMLLSACKNNTVFITFWNALSEDLRKVCTDPYGSHVIESLLTSGLMLLENNDKKQNQSEATEDITTDLIMRISNFGKYCINNLDYFLGHTYASHVIRTLIEVWSGIKMETSIRESKKTRNLKRKLKSFDERKSESLEPSDVLTGGIPNEFMLQLEEFSKKMIQRKDLIDCILDNKISPVIGTLIFALHKRNVKLYQKFLRILIKQISKSTDTEGELPVVCTDQCGSYVIEKIITTSNKKVRKWMWKNWFCNSMKLYVKHPIASFIARRFLLVIEEAKQFEVLFNETSPLFEELLEVNQTGIIICIAETCIRLGCCQAQFMKDIMKAFHCFMPVERQIHLVPLMCYMMKYETFEKSEKKITEFGEVSFSGSVLVERMLSFHKPMKVVNSLLSLQDDLKSIAFDVKGVHVIETFLNSQYVGEKNREKLLQILQPYMVLLACDKYGSRAVDALWKVSTMKQRIKIAQKLSEEESKLNGNQFGSFISKKCSLFYFKKRINDWKELQNENIKKQKLFQEIVE